MLAMGLSMFGVFEIGVKATTMGNDLQRRKGYAGSFWSGALATVISTPCSAPFLGQAIGAAMLQPPLGIVLCLTMMGLGMSLPYIILGAFPVLTKYLPKPGAWMESFKQAMSFLMFGTAAYFLWIYMAFFDADNHPQDILFLFFGLVLFSWPLGIRQMVPHVPQQKVPRHGRHLLRNLPAVRPVLHASAGRSRLVRPRFRLQSC